MKTFKFNRYLITGLALLFLVSCSGEQGDQGQPAMNNDPMPTSSDGPGEAGMDMSGTQGMQAMNQAGAQEIPAADALEMPRPTDNALFLVTIEPEYIPLPLNQIHTWTLTLRDPSGQPVDGAMVTVEGGMPAHNHGMPTSPQVTDNPGNGRYRVEGVQFQMPGHWVVTFNIAAGDQADEVTYNLMLQP